MFVVLNFESKQFIAYIPYIVVNFWEIKIKSARHLSYYKNSNVILDDSFSLITAGKDTFNLDVSVDMEIIPFKEFITDYN